MKYNIDITELWNNNFDEIDTPDGYQKINALVKKPKKECFAVMFYSNTIIECSESHMFQLSDFSWIKSKDLVSGMEILTKDGTDIYLYKVSIGTNDVYDLEVNHKNHRYYSEGISSHNTGKTSTATALIKEIGCEALFINASMDNGIDLLRGKITNFAGTESFDGKLKIVVLDEIDNLSPSAMFAFRNLIESFANNCRFILTGNYKEKILKPLLDRLENYDFNNLNKQEMVKPIFERLKAILENENIAYDPKDLVPIINTYYPSIRSMVGALQKFSTSGTFTLDLSELDNQSEYLDVLNTVKTKDFITLINLVNDLNSPSNMYTYIYKNINLLPKQKMPQVITILARYQHQDGTVRDKNLNLSACLTELMGVI